LSKEDLSITVLIDFPFEIVFGYYAGRWSSGKSPLRPWIFGFAGRLVAAVFAQLIVICFPSDGKVTTLYFGLIIAQHLLSSFMSTIQFVSLCAFHTKIADPAIGGTYMTTLNTLSNYGGTWPRLITYYLIDRLTVYLCISEYDGTPLPLDPTQVTDAYKDSCEKLGGKAVITQDGYYYTNALCVILGVIILFWVKRKATYLQSLPNSAWRVNKG
jgi:PAT family acetyl-CoA transporter-like MFS transporter 1